MTREIVESLAAGRLIPYLGAGVLALSEGPLVLPASQPALAAKLTSEISVPFKIRGTLTAAAQFIENFKHRKTLRRAMEQAFAPRQAPSSLHRFLASLSGLRLMVHCWHDDLPQQALADRTDWGMIQGVSQSEDFGTWCHAYRADGTRADDASGFGTILYQPFGSVAPSGNFLVSDTDFVEVLTEIDIQTPIPSEVQALRTTRGFLFLGCRFSTQLERIFAHQIMKRSAGPHFAVLPETPTRNEARFLEQHGIVRLDTPLTDFVAALSRVPEPV